MDPFLLYFFWRSNLQNLHSSPSSPGWQSSRWKPWNPEVGPMKSAPAALTPMASMMTPLQTPNASKPTSREGTWGVPSEGTGNSSRELRSSQSWKQHQITRTYLYTLHSDTFGTSWIGAWPQRVSERVSGHPHVWDEAEAWTHCLEESFTDAQGRDAPRCLDVDILWCVQVSKGSRQDILRYSIGCGTVSKIGTVQFVLDYISRQVFGQHWTTIEVIIMRSIGTL